MNTKANIQDSSHWLISSNLLDKELAEQVFTRALDNEQSTVRYLVAQGILDSLAIAEALSAAFRIPLFDLDAIDSLATPLNLIDIKQIQKHQVLPLYKRGQILFLGISDPSNTTALDELKFHTGCKIETVIVEEKKLHAAIQGLVDQSLDGVNQRSLDNYLEFQTQDTERAEDQKNEDEDNSVDETPVMRLVNKMLLDAITHGISDIHLEPYEKSSRIRFREDGILREITRPPSPLYRKICSRLKIMASLDISEKRLPQDGRFKLSISNSRAVDFRISTLPTLWGEKIVLRVLDPEMATLDLDSLGYSVEQKQLYLDALYSRQGLILITGPTGSGKSLSLYAGLALINTQERNIATVEDPVEIHMQGVNQVAINNTIGLDFPKTLRAFLRQDPDVLMVGEIRDLQTAEITCKASQTGHLVLSTLHTNNALESFTRLKEMGITPYHLASSISLIIAQRLVRTLCNHCKKPVKLPEEVLLQEGFSPEQLEDIALFGPSGCEQCISGYKGRTGIYEIVPITESISHAIMDGESSKQISAIARKNGFNSLRDSALEKAAQGLISLIEVNGVT